MPQDLNDPNEVDGAYDELDEPVSRLGMMTGTLVAIGVATLLIFSGVTWYAYNAGVDHAEEGALPVVNAEPGDIKVKPDDPGGTNFAHQDKTVYDKIDGNEAGLEQLLPGSEEPKEKPRIITPYDNELPEAGQPKVVRVPPPANTGLPPSPVEAPEVTAPEIPDPMGRAKQETGETEKVAAEPAPEVSTGAFEDPDPAGSMPEQENEPAKTEPAPETETAPDQAGLKSEAALAAKTTPGGKDFVLQLGAFRSQEAADAGWKLLAARHAGVLGKLEHYITQADLGERGRFFRLQAGPFPERGAANEQCAALKSAGVDCLVAAR